MIWMIIGYGKAYLDKCSRDHIGAYAAQAAYFIIVSAIPFLMLLLALFSFSSSMMNYVNIFIQDIIPSEMGPYVDNFLEVVLQSSAGIISVSALMAIWSSGKAFQNLMVGLNVVHQIKVQKNWLFARLWSIVYTMLLLFAMVVIMLMLVFTQQLQALFSNYYGFIAYVVGIRPMFRFIFVFFFLILLFTILFMALPNKKLSFWSQLPGGVLCAASWYVFSAFLAIWVKIFGAFSMYGTLATLMIFLFWLYFCMYFMLMCAEANVFFEQAFCIVGSKIQQKFIDKYFTKWTKKK